MDIQYRCDALKGWLAAELPEALDARERNEVLVAALYELSRSVLPALGHPVKTREYLEGQAAVQELISFIAIPLIRSCTGDTRGVAVLTEIAEGCRDPLLKKKLSVYAQELLAKARPRPQVAPQGWVRRAPWFLGAALTGVLGVYLALPLALESGARREPPPAARLRSLGSAQSASEPAATQPGAGAPDGLGLASAAAARERETACELPAQAAADGRGGASAVEQTTTKVRIVNNQVLVPVVLKNDGETVRAELVLDTGATRSSIHDGVANRLRIDLRSAKLSLAEVADGRLIHSLGATVDSLSVGPFTVASAELDVIPYKGNLGVHDGLLGMDFLGKHRYQIDMEHELIRWF